MAPRHQAGGFGQVRMDRARSGVTNADILRWATAISVAALAYSYQFTTPILLTTNADTGLANLVIKGVLAAAFGGVSLAAFAIGRRIAASSLALVAFMLMLGVRLLYDVLILGIIPMFQTEFYVLAYYFGLCCLPVLAVLLVLRPSDVRSVHQALFWMLVAANVTLTTYIFTGGTVAAENMFAGRFEVAGDLDMTAVLNPIGVATAGAALASMSIGRLTVLRSLGTLGQAFALAMTLLGVTNLLIGGSRGPALAFALVILVTIYTLVRGFSGGGLIKPRIAMWVYGTIIATGFTALIASRAMSVQVFDRFAMMFESRRFGGLEERDFVLANAMADFIESPFFGSSYLTTVGRMFPHNIVVDVFMATGVIGFTAFAAAFVWAGGGLIRMIHGHTGPHGYAVALTTICVLVLGITSGAAWQTPEFWVMLAVVATLGNRTAGHKRRRTRGPGLVRRAGPKTFIQSPQTAMSAQKRNPPSPATKI